MSTANIEEQTVFIKEQLNNLYYDGFYEQMLIEDPERLSAEIELLLQNVSDPKSIPNPL